MGINRSYAAIVYPEGGGSFDWPQPIPPAPPEYQDFIFCDSSGCNYNNDTGDGIISNVDIAACQQANAPKEGIICCTQSGGCDTQDSNGNNTHVNQWDFNYVSGCQATKSGTFGLWSTNYTYETQRCGAQDRCDTPDGTGQGSDYRIYPGQCNPACTGSTTCTGSNACTAGGWYKSCCTGGETSSNPTPQGTCNVIPLQQACNPGSPTAANVTSCTLSSTPPPPTGTTLSCSEPDCGSGGPAVRLNDGTWRCTNQNITPKCYSCTGSGGTCTSSSTGTYNISTCNGQCKACPNGNGWTGEACQTQNATRAKTCATDPNKCNTCSVDYCLLYKSPSSYCWFNNGSCVTDPNLCRGYGNCSSVTGCVDEQGDKYPIGAVRTKCSEPNACTVP